jgi:hypothetical protein
MFLQMYPAVNLADNACIGPENAITPKTVLYAYPILTVSVRMSARE